MPKINTTIFKEGDVIQKSDITSVGDEVEAIDTVLDEDNIREEGLDRRVFDTFPWTRYSDDPEEIKARIRLHRHEDWAKHSAVEILRIPWDTADHSDVIIRCSFFIDSRGSDLSDASVRVPNDDWEFGLHVTHPDETLAIMQLSGDTYNGGIWPYARIGLSKAFQRDSKVGGDGEEAPGAWYQHAFTKESQISQSVTLVYHAHSRKVTESIPGTKLDRSHVWNENGYREVRFVYRSRLESTGLVGVYIRGFNLSYQTYRR